MFFSNFISSAALVLVLILGVHAHAGVNPALGVNGNMARSDVKRPNNNCGGVNVGVSIDSSTAVQAAADGTFQATVVNFNGGADGSRQMSAVVDATGRGNAFQGKVQVTQNGQRAPQGTGSEPLTAKLPAGTRCAGGRTGNLCLVSFKSTAGFGNCVVVRQAGNGRRGLVAAGSRSPRALLQEIEARGEEAVEVVKRSVTSWLWA
ncbi:gas1-like protein [Moniliophthora roreri MCA 2997]|uniref:Gas1-like protein n=1 Tax=Moniliophthora roreri (strain MCA 2997) TaxID=1381753 RepID=V2YNU2_MONRO|nr:gas1-like protein [Moniliophthora roreri MCA 2997]